MSLTLYRVNSDMNPAPSSQAIVYVYYFLLFTNCPSLIQVNLDEEKIICSDQSWDVGPRQSQRLG